MANRKLIRLTVRTKADDPSDDLRVIGRLRRDLWAHSPVETDPDSPRNSTRRDQEGHAYFEVLTEFEDQLDLVLQEYDYLQDGLVMKTVLRENIGGECLRCEYVVEGDFPAVCPNCGFREVSDCPYCDKAVPLQAYLSISGDLFQCPSCKNKVRLEFHDPVVLPDGDYPEPMVIVSAVEESVT